MSLPNPQPSYPEYDDTIEMQLGELEMQVLREAAAAAMNVAETLPAAPPKLQLLQLSPPRAEAPAPKLVTPVRNPPPTQGQLRFAVVLSVAAMLTLIGATAYLADTATAPLQPVHTAQKPVAAAPPVIGAGVAKTEVAVAKVVATPTVLPIAPPVVALVHTQVAAPLAAPLATQEPPPVSPEESPVRVRNPFDRSEVFEFPPGTSRADARSAVAELLMQRARERSGGSVNVPRRKTADKDASAPAEIARRS
ncbi:MAG: hypothetical protein WDO56_17060 [Gammaproteobacteria bacterium]